MHLSLVTLILAVGLVKISDATYFQVYNGVYGYGLQGKRDALIEESSKYF